MSTHGYVISVDPAELANRFPDPASLLGPDDEPEKEDEEFTRLFNADTFKDVIEPLLDRIPAREADFIYLYYSLKKRQADIAAIFEVTQAAVSYSLGRGIQRIKFLLELPAITDDELRALLEEIFDEPIDVDILMGIWTSTCQTVVAKELQLTQGKVRHRLFRAVKTLKAKAAQDPKYAPAEKVFTLISSKKYKFNILRRVELPQWGDKGTDRVG